MLAGTGWLITDAHIYLVTTLYFWKIDQDWFKFFYIVLGHNFIGLIGALWLPESPRMLHARGCENEAMKILNQIAKINKMKLPFAEVAESAHV